MVWLNQLILERIDGVLVGQFDDCLEIKIKTYMGHKVVFHHVNPGIDNVHAQLTKSY